MMHSDEGCESAPELVQYQLVRPDHRAVQVEGYHRVRAAYRIPLVARRSLGLGILATSVMLRLSGYRLYSTFRTCDV